MTKINTESYRAIRCAINPKLAEQDWLECNILAELFSVPYFAKNFVFTGGGTLTKAYQLSTRQGHDIDLACMEFDEIPDNHSHAALNKFRRMFKDYVFDVLKPKVNYIINQDKRFMVLTDRDWRALREKEKVFSNPSLHFLYQSMVQPDFGHLCIEFMPRHYNPENIIMKSVTPYATGQAIGQIPTLQYEQTFWDKVYAVNSINLLKVNDFRETFSRHYYDLANMSEIVDVQETAPLFQNIEDYQKKYTCKDIDRITSMNDICLIPHDKVIDKLGMDYNVHIAPRTRTPWSWVEIIHRLNNLNRRIRDLNPGR